MFRLPIGILRGSRERAPVRRVTLGKSLPMPVRSTATGWMEPIQHLKPSPMRAVRTTTRAQASGPADVRRLVTDTDHRLKVGGKVLAKFVTCVLGFSDGYDRYLKWEAQRLRSRGKPWSRMTAKELRDEIRDTLAVDLCGRYLRGERTAWFVQPSYRGNPVRVYRDAQNREFCFVIAEDRPEVIGIFPMSRFLTTDRQRTARRRAMFRSEPRTAS